MTFSDDRERIFSDSWEREASKNILTSPPTNVAPPISIPPDDDPGRVRSLLVEKVAPRSLSTFFPSVFKVIV